MNESTRKKGNKAEVKARIYLENNGFSIVECNYYTPYGEIDIIATKDSIYHFIEVKSGNAIEPLLNVTSKKLDRVYKSVSLYLACNNLDVAYCVDVITIKHNKISFYTNVSI